VARASFRRRLFDSLNRGHKKVVDVGRQTGQNVDDLLFTVSAHGEDEQVRSIAEINSRGKVLPFVCVRTAVASAIPGCHRMHCDGCRAEVWMSPATKTTFDRIESKVILCLECAMPGFGVG
jgi:hypothetical protein